MKKKGIIALIIGIVAAALLALSACGIWSSDERFPHDVAEEHGVSGSPDGFLASLENPATDLRRLFDEAKEDGSFTGNYFEFLQALGIEEDEGAAVQTALRSVVSVRAAFYPGLTKAFYSCGAGIVYSLDTQSGDALIVTNYHVVYSPKGSGRETIANISDEIALFPYGWEITGDGIEASFLGGAMEYDIAVLKVENCPELQAARGTVALAEAVSGDSESVAAGERVYAIGNPEGMGMSVVDGVVSVESEYVRFKAADEQSEIRLPEIRISAPVNHGNSGGGLFNASGRLIGIVNGRLEEDGVLGFGYAIPANFALSVAQNVIDTCAANEGKDVHCGARARLGIDLQVSESRGYYSEEAGRMLTEEKIVITGVSAGSMAERAGITPGDTIISARLASGGGTAFEAEVWFTRLVKFDVFLLNIRRGDTAVLTLSRGGKTVEITLSFGSDAEFIPIK